MYLLIATWLSITLIALIVGDGGLFLGKLTWLPVNVCSRHCWASVLWMERLKECVAWRWSSLRGLLSWLHVRLGWLFLLSWIVSRLTTLYWLQCFLEVLIAFLRLEFEFLEQRVARLCPSYLICLTCDILIFLCFIFRCKFISIEFLDGVYEGSMRCFLTVYQVCVVQSALAAHFASNRRWSLLKGAWWDLRDLFDGRVGFCANWRLSLT